MTINFLPLEIINLEFPNNKMNDFDIFKYHFVENDEQFPVKTKSSIEVK